MSVLNASLLQGNYERLNGRRWSGSLMASAFGCPGAAPRRRCLTAGSARTTSLCSIGAWISSGSLHCTMLARACRPVLVVGPDAWAVLAGFSFGTPWIALCLHWRRDLAVQSAGRFSVGTTLTGSVPVC